MFFDKKICIFANKNTPMKTVQNLLESERNILQDIYKNSTIPRLRERSHIILLSDKNYKVKELSKIFDYHRVTICSLIEAFNTQRISGLYDAPKSGCPVKITREIEQFVLKMVAKDSRNLKIILNEVEKKFDTSMNKLTLIRFLKKKNLYGNECVSH